MTKERFSNLTVLNSHKDSLKFIRIHPKFIRSNRMKFRLPQRENSQMCPYPAPHPPPPTPLPSSTSKGVVTGPRTLKTAPPVLLLLLS